MVISGDLCPSNFIKAGIVTPARSNSVIASIGVVREENESLAWTMARAMGITPMELRAELQRCALAPYEASIID